MTKKVCKKVATKEKAPAVPVPKGLRYNNGKAELSMILEAKHALTGAANVLSFGKEKYARGNWREGLSHTETCNSLLRHLSDYLAGEDTDSESDLPHADHILVNALFLAEMVRTNPELDDRSKPSFLGE